tara:strand:- start:12814 stop:13062 length:249 start_codon:yes stop_codon:yes gene_type:complete
MSNIEKINEQFPELEVLQADGFDRAIIGLEPLSGKLIYDINKMIDILLEDGLSHIDAIEHLDFNVLNAYVGEKTPLYIHTID